MGGNTGNLRTLRNQSGTVGYRTLGSILTSGNAGGAGSVRRVYAYYRKQNPDLNIFTEIFNIYSGEFRSRARLFLKNVSF